MKATLSYPYVGKRFPELNGEKVVVKEIAELADIPYILLKNRMNMKAKRTLSLKSVWISDADLEPKKRSYRTRSVSKEDEMQKLSNEFLRKPLL